MKGCQALHNLERQVVQNKRPLKVDHDLDKVGPSSGLLAFQVEAIQDPRKELDHGSQKGE